MAGNLLLGSLDGPAAVTAFARSLGDAVPRLDRRETQLNEATPGDPCDTTTPAATAANLRALVAGEEKHLSARSREQLTAWLVANRTGDARLRAGLSRDWCVGDKTGTGEHGTTNDVAVLWPPRKQRRQPRIVCVYLTETAASLRAPRRRRRGRPGGGEDRRAGALSAVTMCLGRKETTTKTDDFFWKPCPYRRTGDHRASSSHAKGHDG